MTEETKLETNVDNSEIEQISKIETPEVSPVVEVVTPQKKKKAATDKQKEALARGRLKLREAQAAKKANKLSAQTEVKQETEPEPAEDITTEEDVSEKDEVVEETKADKKPRSSVKKPVLKRTATEKIEEKSNLTKLSRVVDLMRQRLAPKFM
jgi:hypothetical protein